MSIQYIMLQLPPLSLYIHFPWCVHKCPYCDFNSHGLKQAVPEKQYLQALLKDLDQSLYAIQGRAIQTIYLGGGTPSLFSGDAIEYLMRALEERLSIIRNAEISMEANPESVTLDKVCQYRAAGINRISLGIQSLQDRQLKRLGRAHDSKTASDAIETVKEAGFTNFNIDLMHGLPDQTHQMGLKDIQEALSFHPPHLSWYQLTIEPHTAFFKKPPLLPNESTLSALQQQGTDQLIHAGLRPYEISAFSRPDFECRHNNHYWAFGDYLGIGAGAHSKITQLHDHSLVRFWKWSNPSAYTAAACFEEGREVIQPTQLPFEFMLNRLRSYKPIERQQFESHTGLPWESLFPYFEKASKKELLKWDADSIFVTDFGRRFYNDLVSLFL